MNKETTKDTDEWIFVWNDLPDDPSTVIGYDNDSLTPEKKLLYRDGKFLYCAHGEELDYTPHIIKWKYY